jgi:hypothetical protein
MKTRRKKTSTRGRSAEKPHQFPASPPPVPAKVSWFRKYKNEIIINVLGSFGAAILIWVLFGLPKTLMDNWEYMKSYAVFALTDPLRARTARSFVNNQFILTKNSDGSVASFNVNGPNTSYHAVVAITNDFDEPIVIKSLAIFGVEPRAKITSCFPQITLAPSQTESIEIPEKSLFQVKDSMIVPALLSGKLLLKVGTEFGAKSFAINGVCFAGTILPGNDRFFLAGVDSTCLKVER